MRTTSFVGRGKSLEELDEILESERWITICGPAGVGKSRLAGEVAARSRPDLANAGGVWTCDLSDAPSVESVCAAVASTLGVPLGGGDPTRELEASIAARGPTLLVLDNCERIPDAATLIVAGWIERLPELWVLTTSRRPLRSASEVVFQLEPLAGDAAAQLFIDRARARRRSFSVDAGSLAAISEIVERLDRLPLAIELAAGHVGTLGLAQIRDRLVATPSSLGSKTVGAAPRHASLDEALRWSWDLLGVREQSALTALSVFAGGFDVERAIEMLGPCDDAVGLLESLTDASLVMRTEDDALQLLQVVRDFARRRLEESAERVDVEQRYVDGVVERCRKREGGASEVGDWEAVLRRLCAGSSRDEAERALVVALRFDEVVSLVGPLSRRLHLLDAAVGAADRASLRTAGVGLLLLARASAQLDAGKNEESLRDRERAIALSSELGDPALRGQAVEALARHAWHEGRVEDARRIFEEAIELQRAAGDAHRVGRALTYLGNALVLLGERELAAERYEEALSLLQRSRDPRGVALALGNLADLDAEAGRLELASRRCQEAIDVSASIGDRSTEASFLTNLAAVSIERGAVGEARAQLERALSLHEEVGNRRWSAIAIGYLGRCFERSADDARAKAQYERALSIHEELAQSLFVGLVGAWLARILARGGALVDARHLLDRSEAVLGQSAWRDVVPIVRREVEELARASGGEVDEPALERATARVQELRAAPRMGLVAEVRTALGELRDVRPSAPPPASPPASQCTISASARWFQVAGEPIVSLQTRRALHLVLAALAAAHASRPDEALGWAALLEAGWPGEKVHPTAAAARVYTAVATLRRMGLRWILLRRDDGYLLDPAAAIARADDRF